MEAHDPIASFLEATQRLLQATATINKTAASGSLDLDTWIERYEGLLKQLGGSRTKAPEDVGDARSCWKISQDILIRLRRLLPDPKDTASAEERQGRALFTEQDIDALDRRLFDLRQKVKLTSDITAPNDRTAAALSDKLTRLDVNDSNPAASSGQNHGNQEDADPGPKKSTVSGSQGTRRGFSEAILRDFILESLSFKSMNYREQDIETAHGSSFDWIFDDRVGDPHPSFSEWLSTTNLGNIYWITGKPGSGKSTLIRYLSDHKRTLRSLDSWAVGSSVTVAGFYFWTSGSQEQRSQIGLLRSLLFQLLSTKTELVKLVLPQLWQKLASMTSKERVAMTLEWSTSELMDGLLTFLDHRLSETKLCLFIDGLDEFEGDHESIIHFFRGLAEGKHASQIKLCLSSRPWPVFERAFEYAVPNLKLQASNFQDMIQYTIDKLSANENVRSAMIKEMDLARKVVETTVELASGVFLWVRLAVGELIRKFDHAKARISDMSDYVSTLPSDLDSLFEVLVFKSQPKGNLSETSRLFQLVRAREIVADFIQDDSATSLSLWELAYALRGGEDDVVALQRTVQQEAGGKVVQRCVNTRSWALNRSVGLLEVYHRTSRGVNRGGSDLNELAQHRVTYLHRTVRDWLILSPGDQVWHRLEIAGDVPKTDAFDPHLRLLRSYILLMKHPLEEPEHHRRLDEWYPGIALALTHARYVVRDPHNLQIQFIDEVEKTISWYWVSRGPEITDHWARNSFGTYEERFGNKLLIPHPYLAICTRFGLQGYVIHSLDAMASQLQSFGQNLEVIAENPDEEETHAETNLSEETPLLHRALEFLCSRKKTIYPLSSLSFVRALLEASEAYASHPTLSALIGRLNTPWSSVLLRKKNVTPWVMVLRHIRDAKRRGWIEHFDLDLSGTERWSSIVECLIQRGADRHAVVLRDSWDPEISAKGVLGHGGILDESADFWIEERLTPFFEDGNLTVDTAVAATVNEGKSREIWGIARD
ncbi:Fc.00g114240.m01.CDS01 [Cosmosporella sp. VM-42]